MTNPIHSADPRPDVQLRLPDGRAFNGPKGSTVEAFLRAADPDGYRRNVAALVNGKLRELTLPLHDDARVTPVDAGDSDGARIYRRSLTFLLIAAAAELFPHAPITVEHSMPFGGYYCEPENNVRFSADDLARIKQRMQALCDADLPIEQVRVPLSEALALFRANGDFEKAELFTRRRKDYVTLYALNGARDYFHGFMLPSTGYLQHFDLREYGDGFILHFPRRRDPAVLQPFVDDPWLARIFQNYHDWLKVIGIPSVNSLNRAVGSERLREVVLIAEALHTRQLARIAGAIDARRDEVRIVLISGPTSAGKTTFSKRLAVQLLARGILPVAIGLDNYFVNREDTPLDATGDYDFEHLDAVDLALFGAQLQQLLRGEKVVQPVYNFRTGRREWGSELGLRAGEVLIIEGIHGLNPLLVAGLPPQAIFRIFINAFTQLNLDKHNRVPTTDTRLLRRMVRDYTHRGYNAAATIRRWHKVREGEKRWIFPYQYNADVLFNSALVYELAALKPLAEPILLQVEPETPERIEANRLRAFLQWFDPIDPAAAAAIPTDSILREFVGGSIMEDFEPWVR